MNKLLESFSEKSLYGAILIFILNIILHIWTLDYSSLDLDEAFSLYYSQGDWKHLSFIFEKDITPPTYYIFLFFWIKILGLSVFKARLLSLIFTSIMIAYIWKIAFEFLNIQAAIYSCIILVLSQFQFETGILIRAYPLTELAAVIAFYYFIKFHQNETFIYLIPYSFFSILAINSHTTSVILIFAWGIVGLFSLAKKKKIWLIVSNLIICLSLLPQYLVFNSDKKEALTRWRTPSKIEDIRTLFNEFYQSEFLLYLSLVLIATSVFFATKSKNKIATMVLVCLLSALVSSYLISKWIPFFYAKYLLYLFPFLTLSASFGISKLSKKRYVSILFSTGIIISFSFTKKLNFQRDENWKKVVEYTIVQSNDDTDIIISPVYMYRPYTYYYDIEKFKDPENLKPKMLSEHRTYFVTEFVSDIFNYRKPKKIILIESHESITPDRNLNTVQKLYELKKTVNIGSIKIHELILRHA